MFRGETIKKLAEAALPVCHKWYPVEVTAHCFETKDGEHSITRYTSEWCCKDCESVFLYHQYEDQKGDNTEFRRAVHPPCPEPE